MLLQMIITNELNRRLGHDTTPAEQRNAFVYVADNLDDQSTLKDINDILADFITDNYCLCDVCGEYVLRDETTEIDGPYHHFRVCQNRNCEQSAYYDANHDEKREWATY